MLALQLACISAPEIHLNPLLLLLRYAQIRRNQSIKAYVGERWVEFIELCKERLGSRREISLL